MSGGIPASCAMLSRPCHTKIRTIQTVQVEIRSHRESARSCHTGTAYSKREFNPPQWRKGEARATPAPGGRGAPTKNAPRQRARLISADMADRLGVRPAQDGMCRLEPPVSCALAGCPFDIERPAVFVLTLFGHDLLVEQPRPAAALVKAHAQGFRPAHAIERLGHDMHREWLSW